MEWSREPSKPFPSGPSKVERDLGSSFHVSKAIEQRFQAVGRMETKSGNCPPSAATN